MSLSPDSPLDVLRDHIIRAALSNYIGKIVTVCGMFLVCYEWGMFCVFPLKDLALALTHFSSHMSR